MTTGDGVLRRADLFDVAIVVVIGLLVEWLVWAAGPGDQLAGPRAFTVLLPLLLALPLWWRRTRPLLAWSVVAGGLMAQSLISHSPEGLEIIACVGVGVYSVAAYSRRRNALLGLGLLVVTFAVYAGNDTNTRTGRTSELWAAAFFALFWLGCWVVGAWRHSRREADRNAARASELEREAELAVTAERGRVARELHDIVAHNLSVVVVQAAGARARADDGQVSSTLEKIEESGREALVEMRRMLGVLRADDDAAELSPQPGLDRIAELCDGVRRAGVPVDLQIEDCGDVSPVVALSAYRIVQEALTNTLKHAGSAQASVCIRRSGDSITIEVADNGRGASTFDGVSGGHGLIGMRERAQLLGGELHAGRSGDGGFVVHARLPIGEHTT